MSRSIKMVGNAFGLTDLEPSKADKKMYHQFSNIDTSLYDMSTQNMQKEALDMSKNLGNRPDYVYQVDASDEARQRAENAVYMQGLNHIMPAYAAERESLDNKLQNQGIAVGSEAYENAMSSLYNSQNNALNNLALSGISAGQKAFRDSFQDSLAAASFQNQTRQLPIKEIVDLLSLGVSGYDKLKDLHKISSDIQDRTTKNNAPLVNDIREKYALPAYDDVLNFLSM